MTRALIAHVWFANPDEIERVSDRVHGRLTDEGSRSIDTPDGWAVPTVSSRDYAFPTLSVDGCGGSPARKPTPSRALTRLSRH